MRAGVKVLRVDGHLRAKRLSSAIAQLADCWGTAPCPTEVALWPLVRKLHAPDDFLESRIGSDGFEHRLYGQGDHAAVVLLIGLLQPLEAFCFSSMRI